MSTKGAGDDTAKLVDSIYKSLLDKFNPCAKQIIAAGKAYLKAMHAAASASKTYLDAIGKLARYSQEGVWGGSADIGSALTQLVNIQNEVQNLQMNVLKAFYVDLIVPLETNLEKDTKAVTVEQKKFVQQSKIYNDAYNKASAAVKKQRKKLRSRSSYADKEIRGMQLLEEEKSRLDDFNEKSMKQAIRQERRRYGFVLERKCALVRHCLDYQQKSNGLLEEHLPQWEDVSKTRETLPEHVAAMFTSDIDHTYMTPNVIGLRTQYSVPASLLMMMNNNNDDDDDDDAADADSVSTISNRLRKSHSINNVHNDTSDGTEENKEQEADDEDDNRSTVTASTIRRQSDHGMSRAKSEANLNSSSMNLSAISHSRPKSMAVTKGDRIVRAIYSYLSSGEHQLSFHEGDMIYLIGERNKGWQFGENLRNSRTGWFPVAYTEDFVDNGAGVEKSSNKDHPTKPSNSTTTGTDGNNDTHYVLPIRRSCTTSFVTATNKPASMRSSESHHCPLLSTFDSGGQADCGEASQTRDRNSDSFGLAERGTTTTTSAKTAGTYEVHFGSDIAPKTSQRGRVSSTIGQRSQVGTVAYHTNSPATPSVTFAPERIQGVTSSSEEDCCNRRDYAMLRRTNKRSMTAPLPIIIPASPLSSNKHGRKDSDSNDSGIGTISCPSK